MVRAARMCETEGKKGGAGDSMGPVVARSAIWGGRSVVASGRLPSEPLPTRLCPSGRLTQEQQQQQQLPRPAMAKSRGPSRDSDQDGVPCAPAPLPLPALQPQRLTPDPQMLLTPEREAPGRAGSGILRRHPPGKAPHRQVRFRLGSKSEDILENGPDPPRPRVEETQRKFASSPAPLPRKLGPSRVAAEEQPSPSALAAPVANSTLALRAEMQAAREREFDARRAAEELVQRSFVTRCAVEARVVEGMNVPRDQQRFQDLVSLNVPEEELLSFAVQEKLAPLRPRPENKKELPGVGPDPMAFYNPEELFTEKACLEVEGLPPLPLHPRRRDPSTTFCMYRKLRQWDS